MIWYHFDIHMHVIHFLFKKDHSFSSFFSPDPRSWYVDIRDHQGQLSISLRKRKVEDMDNRRQKVWGLRSSHCSVETILFGFGHLLQWYEKNSLIDVGGAEDCVGLCQDWATGHVTYTHHTHGIHHNTISLTGQRQWRRPGRCKLVGAKEDISGLTPCGNLEVSWGIWVFFCKPLCVFVLLLESSVNLLGIVTRYVSKTRMLLLFRWWFPHGFSGGALAGSDVSGRRLTAADVLRYWQVRKQCYCKSKHLRSRTGKQLGFTSWTCISHARDGILRVALWRMTLSKSGATS